MDRLRAEGPAAPAVTIHVDGAPLQAQEGDTIAAALMAAGRRVLRHTLHQNRPRGLFCGMGICFDCLVTVAGGGRVRACTTAVRPGLRIETGRQAAGRSGAPHRTAPD